MPKRAFFESAKHHLLLQAKNIASQQRLLNPKSYTLWRNWVNSFVFNYIDSNTIKVTWEYPTPGSHTFSIKKVQYYTRGDTADFSEKQKKEHLLFNTDSIKIANDLLFQDVVKKLSKKANIPIYGTNNRNAIDIARIHDEEELSDHWAIGIDPNTIDVIHTNTASTSPELRYLHDQLGDVSGKKILDLGCGLGEVSIFFALKGATVTAVDLSQPMLDVVQNIAKRYQVQVQTLHASVEELGQLKKNSFDIIYVGNLFHHVDISKTLRHVIRILKITGTLVCWEPVHYNPIINIYRAIAKKVRSRDERPFRMRDIELFKQQFESVQVQWFWLSTLIIFVIMAVFERRDPNKERYWKEVVAQSKKWSPLYLPLEKLDRLLLKTIPQLGPLCWNLTLICKKPMFKN